MRAIVLMLAFAAFGSAAFGGLRFFVVVDEGSRRGRRLTSALFSAGALIVLLLMFRHETVEPWRSIVVATMFSCSLAIFWWSIATAKRNLTSSSMPFLGSSEPGSVQLEAGPYRYVRHPFYLSYMLSWWAAGLYATSIGTMAVGVVMTTLYVKAALQEESVMHLHRSGYRDYAARTGRFLPPLRAMAIDGMRRSGRNSGGTRR
jgi:protein-S-isoprenylcysteine O-methyltransferase Ste14